MITRDGDHFVIGNERLPAKTECAGRVWRWRAKRTGGFGLDTKRVSATVLENGDWYFYSWTVRAEGHEPTVRDAQRRVIRVLAALLEPLGEE